MLNTHVRPSRDCMDVYAEFENFLHRGFIYEELQKSKAKLADPNTKRTDAATVFDRLKKKRESAIN